MRKREWKGEEKMYQNHRDFGRGERLTQYAIELFDLVDISSTETAEQTIDLKPVFEDFINPPVFKGGVNDGSQGLTGKINYPGIESHHGRWHAGVNNSIEKNRVLALQTRGQAC